MIDDEIVTFWLNDISSGVDSQCIFGASEASNALNGPSYELKLDKLNDSWWTVTLKGSHYGDRKSSGTPKAILDTGTSFLAIA